jgi:hypothetical protein
MARPFGSSNHDAPQWLTRMSAKAPACYAPVTWMSYLRGVQAESQDNDALRAKLNRGQVPNYCLGCTSAHRKTMRAQRKCTPHPDATPPTARGATKRKRAKTLPLHRAVVSLCVRTWQTRAFGELGAVLAAGYSPKAVHQAIATGKPYKGRLQGGKPAPAAPSVFGLMVSAVTDSQIQLDLGALIED